MPTITVTDTTNWICQPHTRFSQCPRWRNASTKTLSRTLVRPPRSRRATMISAAASAASDSVLNTIATRKSGTSSSNPRYSRRGTGRRCSLFCDHTQAQKSGSRPASGRTMSQSSFRGMLKPEAAM
jgi:hypothetical protein